MGRRLLTSFVAFALIALSLPFGATPAAAASADLVISQIYGGGGNAGAPLQNDFVEIFNRGSVAVALSGKSVQYTSATGTGNLGASGLLTTLTGALNPGQYLLVKEAGSTANGVPLPVADVTGAINMSATGGKVAIVNSTTSLGCNGGSTPCSPAQLALIIDLIGYDGANFFEGSAGPTLSNTTAAFRAASGCTDTDNNAADFAAAAPAPRNTASPLHFCVGDVAPAVSSTSPANGASGVAVVSNITITFTEPVNVAAGWYDITCTSGTRSATVTGGPTAFTLDPATDFATDESCTVTVFAANVADQDVIDPPDNMDANYTFSFHTFTPPTPIHAIQGPGSTSPLVGQLLNTTGIVTGLKSNGFFMQTPDSDVDADPSTSEGIFVFTSSAPPATAVVGNLVQVSAKVQEFIPGADPFSPPATELITPSVSVVASGQPLPAAITLTTADANPSSPLEQLERYEGMRVHVDSLTVTGPTLGSLNETTAISTSTGIFYGVLTGVARPFREPGIQAPEPPALPGIPVFDNNPERIGVNSAALSPRIDVTSGATVTNLSGPLDYSFRTYTIIVDAGSTPGVSGNIGATPVRAPSAIEFTVASSNMERFFDTVNDPDTSDAVLTNTAFANRLNKISLAIRTILRSPDIIGAEEIENLTVLQAIAAKVNADAVAAGAPDPGYVAFLEEGNDIGGIDVGFLVKSSRVTVVDVTQFGKDATYIDPNTGLPALLNDRPSLVLRATIQSPIGAPYPVTVIVNHLRSLSGINGDDGNRIRTKRRAQAEWLANFIQGRQTADPTEHIISVGDYNAFQFNDGYVDSIGTIKGTPTPASQVTLSSGDLVNPDLIDLIDTVAESQRYSFVFDGSAQELDHVLITSNLTPRFDELQYGRIDADFNDTARNDPNSPLRVSDHDPIVAFFSLPDTVPPTITVVQAPAANSNNWNNTDVAVTFTCADNVGIASCVGSTTLTAETAGQTVTGTATDTSGNTATASITVRIDKTAPTFTWTGALTYTIDQTVAITCAASDSLSGIDPALPSHCDGASGPAFSFGLGTHTLTAAATDNAGNSASASTTFTISVSGTSLCALTRTFVSDAGIASSLCAKLDAAAASAARGNAKTHDNQVAAYINEVNAQRGKAISDADATTLIALAGAL